MSIINKLSSNQRATFNQGQYRETDIGLPKKEIPPEKQKKFEEFYNSLPASERNKLDRMIKAQRKETQSSFDKNYEDMLKRNREQRKEKAELDYRIKKDAQDAQDKAEAKLLKDKEAAKKKQISKAEKDETKRENMKIDLDKIVKDDELFKVELQNAIDEYIDTKTYGPDKLTEENNKAIASLKASLENKHRIQRNYNLIKAVEAAFKKFNGDAMKVREFFRSRGLEKDLELILNNMPSQ
tara:strand:- start:1983 stop:2702 length:720 start_codon:yes stop_codon:yes gene_type:complete